MVLAFSILSKIQIAIGIIQFFTCYAIIGWVWSIAWGGLIVMKGIKSQKPAPPTGAQGQFPPSGPKEGPYP